MNYFLAFLRILACYAVVSIHYGTTLPYAGLAVPIFMVMAFYFYHDETSFTYFKKRLLRIALPFLAWSFVGFVARSFADGTIEWKMLGLQLLFGMPTNSPLYFMNLLMVNTVIVFAIEKWLAEIKLWFYVIIVIACLALEYSSFNGYIWTWLPRVGEITCGRFVELLPLAIAGRCLHMLDKKSRIKTLICGVLFCSVCTMFDFIGICVNGNYYNYGGLHFFLMAPGIVAVLGFLGETVAKNSWADRIAVFSGLTGGIYYTHKIVGEAIRRVLPLNGPLLTCSVFVISAVLVMMLSKNSFAKRIVS